MSRSWGQNRRKLRAWQWMRSARSGRSPRPTRWQASPNPGTVQQVYAVITADGLRPLLRDPTRTSRERASSSQRGRDARDIRSMPPNPLAGGNSPDRDTICTLLSLRRWFFNMFGTRDACLSVKRAYGGLINLLADTRDLVRIHFARDHIASARADFRSV